MLCGGCQGKLGLIENIYKIKTIQYNMAKKKKGVEKELPKTKEGLGIAGFTLGIVSIVVFIFGWMGFIFSIIGFSLSMKQQKKAPMKLAKTGIILNIIGFVLSLIMLAIITFSSLAGKVPLQ